MRTLAKTVRFATRAAAFTGTAAVAGAGFLMLGAAFVSAAMDPTHGRPRELGSNPVLLGDV